LENKKEKKMRLCTEAPRKIWGLAILPLAGLGAGEAAGGQNPAAPVTGGEGEGGGGS